MLSNTCTFNIRFLTPASSSAVSILMRTPLEHFSKSICQNNLYCLFCQIRGIMDSNFALFLTNQFRKSFYVVRWGTIFKQLFDNWILIFTRQIFILSTVKWDWTPSVHEFWRKKWEQTYKHNLSACISMLFKESTLQDWWMQLQYHLSTFLDTRGSKIAGRSDILLKYHKWKFTCTVSWNVSSFC